MAVAFLSASVLTGRLPATVWSTEWASKTSGFTVLKMNRRMRREQQRILTSGWLSSWPGLSLFAWCVFGEQTCTRWLTYKQQLMKCFDSHVVACWSHMSMHHHVAVRLFSPLLFFLLHPDLNFKCLSNSKKIHQPATLQVFNWLN